MVISKGEIFLERDQTGLSLSPSPAPAGGVEGRSCLEEGLFLGWELIGCTDTTLWARHLTQAIAVASWLQLGR